MRWVAVVALAVVVVSAGCSGGSFGGDDGTGADLVTPAPVPTERERTATTGDGGARFPPGVEPTGLDPGRLAAAHAAVARNRSYTLTISETLRATERRGDRLRTRVAQESPQRYRASTAVVAPDDPGSPTVVEDVFVVNGTAHWVFYGERARNDSVLDSPGERRYARYVRRAIARHLDVGTVSLTRTTHDGAPAIAIHGTSPATSFGDAPDYRVEAIVGMDGFVHSLRAAYRVDGEAVTVEIRYSDLGNTTAVPPDWLGATDSGA